MPGGNNWTTLADASRLFPLQSFSVKSIFPANY